MVWFRMVVWYGLVELFGMLWHGLVGSGCLVYFGLVVWYGLALFFGMVVWYDLAWYGLV